MSQSNTPKIENNPPAAVLPTPTTSTPAAPPATPYATAQWPQHRMHSLIFFLVPMLNATG